MYFCVSWCGLCSGWRAVLFVADWDAGEQFKQGYPSSEEDLVAPKTAIKLIHMGKILSNDAKIAHTVLPSSFVVMMPPKGSICPMFCLCLCFSPRLPVILAPPHPDPLPTCASPSLAASLLVRSNSGPAARGAPSTTSASMTACTGDGSTSTTPTAPTTPTSPDHPMSTPGLSHAACVRQHA
jgi:hypothetical protein